MSDDPVTSKLPCDYQRLQAHGSMQTHSMRTGSNLAGITHVGICPCRTSTIEDNPRVPKPDPARRGTVSDEDLVKEGTVRIVGGDTPAREAFVSP